MLNIENRVFITIKIDGQDIGSMPAGFGQITLPEGNMMRCPSFQLELADRGSTFVGDRAITDGNKVEVAVSKSMSDNQYYTRTYRVFKPKGRNAALGPTLDIIGILDKPKYMLEATNESYKGTSDDVLKALATKCGMTFSGPKDFNGRSMNDSQVWLHSMNSRSTFMLDIVKHAWQDKNSGMVMAVTSLGELRFRNLVDVINTDVSKIRYLFLHNALPADSDSRMTTYKVRAARERSLAGVANASTNYGSTRVEDKLSGTHDKVETFDVKTKGSYLAINQEIKNLVKRARFDYSPIDCGNSHKNYQAAVYQNQKVHNLFSERLSVLVYDVTEVQLLDPVIYRQADADLSKPVKASDVYVVVGKTIKIQNAAYYAERIELARMSLTMAGSTTLMGPSSADSEKSMLPDVTIASKATTAGQTAASAAKAKGLGTLAQAVKDANTMVANAKAQAAASLASITNGAAALVAAVKSGVSSEINSAFSAISPGMTNAVKDMKNQAGLAVASESAINALLKQHGDGISSAAKQLAILGSGNPAELISNHLMASAAYRRAMTVVSKSLSKVPSVQKALPGVVDASSKLDAFSGHLSNVDKSLGRQWNSVTGYVSSTPVPATPKATSATTEFGQTVNTAMCVPTKTDSDITSIVGSGLTNSMGSTPAWCTETSFAPTDVSLDTSQTMLQGAIARLKNNGG